MPNGSKNNSLISSNRSQIMSELLNMKALASQDDMDEEDTFRQTLKDSSAKRQLGLTNDEMDTTEAEYRTEESTKWEVLDEIKQEEEEEEQLNGEEETFMDAPSEQSESRLTATKFSMKMVREAMMRRHQRILQSKVKVCIHGL